MTKQPHDLSAFRWKNFCKEKPVDKLLMVIFLSLFIGIGCGSLLSFGAIGYAVIEHHITNETSEKND